MYDKFKFIGLEQTKQKYLDELTFRSGLSLFNTEQFLEQFVDDFEFLKLNDDSNFQNGFILTKMKNRFGFHRHRLPRMARTSGYVFSSRSVKQERLERDIDSFLDALVESASSKSFINFESNMSPYIANKVHHFSKHTVNRNLVFDFSPSKKVPASLEIEHLFKENIRRQVKKSNKNYSFELVELDDRVFQLIKETFNRNGIGMPITIEDQAFLRKLQIEHPSLLHVNAAISNATGDLEAAVLVLNDLFSHRYLYSGVTVNALQNGTISGLLNRRMKEAVAQGKTFDFCGSNSAGIARFFQALGGQSELYFTVTK